MLEWLVFGTLLVLLGVQLYTLYFSRNAKITRNIPGPPPLPFIGNALDIGSDPVGTLRNFTRIWKQYGDIFKVWLGSIMVVMISNPHHLEVFLTDNENLDKAITYQFLEKWLCSGLLLSTGKKWKEHRKLITPSFHFTILQQFVEIFNRNNNILVKKLSHHVDGPPFDVYQYVNLSALDVICETSLGVSVHAQANSESDYVKAVKGMAEIVMKRSFTPWLHSEVIFNLSKEGKMHQKYLEVLHNTTRRVIKSRKEDIQEQYCHTSDYNTRSGKKKKLALLDMLLETSKHNNSMTDEDVREEIDTFMFEGHDTSASAMAFCLWSLATHQTIQDKAYAEIRDIFGDSSHETTYNDLQNMKYLECVIKETLRLYPSVPMYGRKLTTDIKLDEYLLPSGTNVVFSSYFLHRNPLFYQNPEQFDPDRFLLTDSQERHPFSYLPFSAGPRNCIGQKFAMLEIKATVAEILKKYKVMAQEGAILELSLEILLRSKNGVFITLEKRENNINK